MSDVQPWVRGDEPDLIDLVRELREAAGLFAGAMPITPREAWLEAIHRVEDLRAGRVVEVSNNDDDMIGQRLEAALDMGMSRFNLDVKSFAASAFEPDPAIQPAHAQMLNQAQVRQVVALAEFLRDESVRSPVSNTALALKIMAWLQEQS